MWPGGWLISHNECFASKTHERLVAYTPISLRKTQQLEIPIGNYHLIGIIGITLPETNSKFAPENGCLQYNPFPFGV